MAKITRYNGNVVPFASESLSGEKLLFGDGTGTVDSDDLTDQYTSQFLRGFGTVGASDFPPLEWFNAQAFTDGQFISYLHQMGVAEWSENQEYPTAGATCVHDDFLWSRTDSWSLTDEPELASDSWYLNHPIFQYAVSQLAGGDKSKVAFIKEGVTIGSYEWMIWPDTGQVFDVNGASGTFGSDFDASTGTATGITGTLIDTDFNKSTKNALNASGSAPIYAIRSWCNFSGDGLVDIRSGGNISTVLDEGTGTYVVNLSIPIEDADFAVLGSAGGDLDANDTYFKARDYSESSFRIIITDSNSTQLDAVYISAAIVR